MASSSAPAASNRVALLAQTTLGHHEWEEVVNEALGRFANLWTARKSDLCYATTNRQAAVEAMAARAGVVLVVGSETSSNTRALVRVAQAAGAAAHRIDGPESIDPSWLAGGQPPEDAEDGILTAEDVTGLDLLDTDLVVLSACQTAAGTVEKGEGISGLSRAFFCAGAKSVLASLWDINDRSTQKFMTYFYRNLVKGRSKEESLRLAKTRMLKTRFRHPYYWAAFILMGESGDSITRSPLSLWDRMRNLF